MDSVGRGTWLRLLVVLAIAALALGAAACGSDDSGSDDGAASAQQQDGGGADDASVDASTPEGQVRATLDQWVKGLQKPDPKLACSVVTPKVQQQLRVVYSKGKGCEDVIRYMAPRVNSGQPRVMSVDVQGAKATMVLRNTKGDREQTMQFTKAGGSWKISDGFAQAPKKVKPQS